MNKIFSHDTEVNIWFFGIYVGVLFLNAFVALAAVMVGYIVYYTMFKYIYPVYDKSKK